MLKNKYIILLLLLILLYLIYLNKQNNSKENFIIYERSYDPGNDTQINYTKSIYINPGQNEDPSQYKNLNIPSDYIQISSNCWFNPNNNTINTPTIFGVLPITYKTASAFCGEITNKAYENIFDKPPQSPFVLSSYDPDM